MQPISYEKTPNNPPPFVDLEKNTEDKKPGYVPLDLDITKKAPEIELLSGHAVRTDAIVPVMLFVASTVMLVTWGLITFVLG